MNTAPLLLPFSPAQFGTLEGAGLPSTFIPAGVVPAGVVPPTAVPAPSAVQPSAFAGVLALAIQPAEPEPAADAPEPTADEHAVAETGDEHKPAVTGPDLSGIASTLNASMIVRDLGALQPAFRAKLERVISRMNEEYGHSVSVTETYRTQARQDQLLQQGRTTSGPIVTWTSRSLHTQGRAADLIVDGKWNNPEGFQRLQEIATQEGLSTLGPRDPGHVEMREDSLTTIANIATITEVAATPQPGQGNSAMLAAPVARLAPSLQAVPAAQAAPIAPIASAVPIAPAAPSAPPTPSAQVIPIAPNAQVAQAAQAAQAARSATARRPGGGAARSMRAGAAGERGRLAGRRREGGAGRACEGRRDEHGEHARHEEQQPSASRSEHVLSCLPVSGRRQGAEVLEVSNRLEEYRQGGAVYDTSRR